MAMTVHFRLRLLFIALLFFALLQFGSIGCKKKEPTSVPSPSPSPNVKNPTGGNSTSDSSFRVPGQDFAISLPGEGWKQSTRNAAPKLANYYRLQPTMLVGLFPPMGAESEKAHEQNGRNFKENAKKTAPTTKVLMEVNTTNNQGDPMWLLLLEERDNNRAMLVGESITWFKKKRTVVLLFEGQYSRDDEATIERERPAFREVAEKALRSVR